MSAVEKLLQELINKTDPVANYYAVDLDEAGNPKYYGFMNSNGYWYIMKLTNAGAVRYSTTSNNKTDSYPTAWTNRAGLTYDYPDKVGLR